MSDEKFTATQIGEIICDAWGLEQGARNNLQHKVRYTAKKGYLRNGTKADARGTLEFPKSEVFRAAIFCEFLEADADINRIGEAINHAERFTPTVNPASARAPKGGGFEYSGGGLAVAVRGVAACENWRFIVSRARSPLADGKAIYGRYLWSGEDESDDDSKALSIFYGKPHAALIQEVDLNAAFGDIIKKIGKL